MFNLVETEPRFNTFELLESMVKVSEIQKERFKDAPFHTEHWVVSFNMGRQCGHTTSIHEYALKHKDENILIVCYNHDMIRYSMDRFNRHENIDYTTMNTNNTVFPINYNYDRIFFDVVPFEKATNFMCNNISKSVLNTVKSIVCVGNI